MLTTRTQAGAHPARRTTTIALLGFALCAIAQAGTLEVLVLDKEGKPLPDAVVIVTPSAHGTARNPPPLNAIINQEKMQFIPAVSIVGVGAKVHFVNNDPWDHHVRMTLPGTVASATPNKDDGLSLRLEGKTAGKPSSDAVLTLDRPGALGAVLLGCFIHGSMSGHVFVAESPWTVKTQANGVAVLDDVPDGAATVRVWQALQLVDKPAQSVAIGSTPAKLTVQLDVVPRRKRV